MKSIFLYRDDGVCPSSLRATVRSLRTVTNRPITLVTRDNFLEAGWEKKAEMVIIPGGRDVPYSLALQGAANRRIRNYVANGGRYFGICAGAYYGSASVCFEKGGPLEVIGSRELSFFPGSAIGPALGLGEFCYENSHGARITSLALSETYFSDKSAKVYYNGGCTFNLETANVTALAHYEDLLEKSPAIILCQVGQGKALLSGVHPEYNPCDLSSDERELFIQLKQTCRPKEHLFSRLITILLE
jgi:biotin--protein ligase